jgi:competence protein ComEA
MNLLKDFFYYTHSERNGVLVLLGVLLILFTLPYTFSFFVEPAPVSFGGWEADVFAFEEGVTQRAISKSKKYNFSSNARGNTPVQTQKTKLNPIPFDPNTVAFEDLEAMGLPIYTIRSIIKYRSKGGQFKTKEALQKIYTLSKEHYQQLLPFIQLKSKDELVVEGKEEETLPQSLPKAFDFDPNTATAEEFEALGLKSNTIRSILNYREKGGQFRTKEDLKKMYTLVDSVYQHLEGYIKIAAAPKFAAKKTYKPKSYYKVDINSGGIDDFQQFKGIGPSYAKRIIKMKEALGGFVSVEQIGELYKLPDSTFQSMLPYLDCLATPVDQININTASVEELKAHPYMRWFHAKAIVKYRETEGLWKSVELVQILSEFDDGKGTFKKVSPYLTID